VRSSHAAPETATVAAPVAANEHEPNDDVAAAQRLPWPDADITGELHAGDRDAFLVTIPDAEVGPFALDVWLEGADTTGIHIEVVRSDDHLQSATAPGRLTSLGLARGATMITVSGSDRARGYRLHVHAHPWAPGAEWEPNDVPDHAQNLDPVQGKEVPGTLAALAVHGTWASTDDVDCYEIPLVVPPKGSLVRVELQPSSGARARVRVLDAGDPESHVTRRLLAQAVSPAPGAPAILPALGGRSWEHVWTACVTAEGADPTARYTLAVRELTSDGPFEFEPNDDAGQASALPDAIAVGAYLPAGDVDWYRLSGRAHTLTVTPPAGLAVEAVLYDRDRHEIARRRGETGAVVTLVAEGAAFAELRAASGAADATYSILAK
jgi:hypothetical protein